MSSIKPVTWMYLADPKGEVMTDENGNKIQDIKLLGKLSSKLSLTSYCAFLPYLQLDFSDLHNKNEFCDGSVIVLYARIYADASHFSFIVQMPTPPPLLVSTSLRPTMARADART